MILKMFLKKIILLFSKFLPHNSIVFESKPDLSDNSKAIFDEMVKRGINNSFKMIWLCFNEKDHPSIYNVKYINRNALYGLIPFCHFVKAKCLISCNTFLPSNGTYQKSFYVMHGVGLKKAGAYTAPNGIDYITCLSNNVNRVLAKELNVNPEIFVSTGFPRNDDLLKNKTEEVHALFGSKYNKVIVWYPTYRQHSTSDIMSDINTYSLPIIHDAEAAENINDYAKKNNVLIVLKPHFSQDMSYIKELGLENIRFIDDSFFANNKLSSYEFVGGCDALITDYSSIYFDYLLCDKPVAAVWEDIDEYKKSRGFAFDIDYYEKGAFKIYTVDDMKVFIHQVSAEEDFLVTERREIRDVVHEFKDSNSTKRVVDFIMSKIS